MEKFVMLFALVAMIASAMLNYNGVEAWPGADGLYDGCEECFADCGEGNVLPWADCLDCARRRGCFIKRDIDTDLEKRKSLFSPGFGCRNSCIGICVGKPESCREECFERNGCSPPPKGKRDFCAVCADECDGPSSSIQTCLKCTKLKGCLL